MAFDCLIRRVLPGGALCAAVVAVTAGSAFAAAGDLVWANRYDGPAHGADSAKAMAVSPDGAMVFVTGGSAGASAGEDRDGGDQRDDRRDGVEAPDNGSANRDDEAIGLAVSPDGSTVYVTGKSQTAAHGFDYITSAYAAATGAVEWTSRFNGTANGDDVPAGIALSPMAQRSMSRARATAARPGLRITRRSR